MAEFLKCEISAIYVVRLLGELGRVGFGSYFSNNGCFHFRLDSFFVCDFTVCFFSGLHFLQCF
jgi:hypothetical protein